MSIIVENLSKFYGERPVISHFSAKFDEGITCIFAPSGSGKTTLFLQLAGIEKPNEGTISGITGPIAIQFQDNLLFPTIDALNNVSCVVKDKMKGKEKAKDLLFKLGLKDEDFQKLPSALSGGMCRRVSLARTLLFAEEHGGNTILLDEPFSGLDEESKQLAIHLIQEKCQNKIVLVVTHQKDDAELLQAAAMTFIPIHAQT